MKKDYKYWENKIIKKINKLWQKSDKFLPCHGPSHHIRVWKRSEQFGIKLKADMEILAASCLLHDVAAFNQGPINNHDLRSARTARLILKSIDFPKDKIEIVYQIISSHRSHTKSNFGLEGDIMKSFDKVDAFGPIGIYRIISPMVIRGYDLDIIVKWFLDDKKIEKKWNSIKFPEIKKKYQKDYLYTIDFFKKLARFR